MSPRTQVNRQCPDATQLSGLLNDSVPDDQTVILHVETCEDCQHQLDQLSDRLSLDSYRQAIQNTQDTSRFLDPSHQPGDLGSIDGITVEAQIGQGGMGVVYRGRDEKLGRRVAVKILTRGNSQESNLRFIRESRAAASLSHPNVVPVYSCGQARDGRPFLVMPFIEGQSLKERLQHQPIPHRNAAEIVRQIASGLEAAHAKNLIHRDVKTANILLDQQDHQSKLLDFGLVQTLSGDSLTQQNVICGTPEYMSPSQIQQPGKPDKRSDLYSLGIVLYECLTGTVPFRGQPLDVLQQHQQLDPVPPRHLNRQIPVDLETICLKALEKDAGRGYQTATEFANDLQRFLEDRPVRARRIGWTGKLRRWVKRKTAVATSLSLAFLLLIAGTTASTLLWMRSEHNAKLASNRLESLEKTNSLLKSNQQDLASALRGTAIPRLGEWQYAMDLPTSVRNQMMVELVSSWRLLFTRGTNNSEELRTMARELYNVGEIAASIGMERRLAEITNLSVEVVEHLLATETDPSFADFMVAAKAYRQHAEANKKDLELALSTIAVAVTCANDSLHQTDEHSPEAKQAQIELFQCRRTELALESQRKPEDTITGLKSLLKDLDAVTDQYPGSIEPLHSQWLNLRQQLCLNLAKLSRGQDAVDYRSERSKLLNQLIRLGGSSNALRNRHLRDQAINIIMHAMELRQLGQHEESMELLLEGQEKLETNVTVYPLNGQYRADLFETRMLIADDMWNRNQRQDALNHYQLALEEMRVTLQMNPLDPPLHHRAAQAHGMLADKYRSIGDPKTAGDLYFKGAKLSDTAYKQFNNLDFKNRDFQMLKDLLQKSAAAFDAAEMKTDADTVREALRQLKSEEDSLIN